MCFYRLEGCYGNGLSCTYSERLVPSILWCWDLVGCSVLTTHTIYEKLCSIYAVPAQYGSRLIIRMIVGLIRTSIGIPAYHFHLAKRQLYAQLFVLNYV